MSDPFIKKIRTLTVTFEQEIGAREVEHFRGAIVEKVGLERSSYHNHNNDPGAENPYFYRYPLVQYTMFRRKPQLLFLESAIDEAQHFFAQPDWDMTVNGRPYPVSISDIKAAQHDFGIRPGEMQHYRLSNWQALKGDNYSSYINQPNLHGKIDLLQRILSGNLLALASGLQYRIPERFTLEITDWRRTHTAFYKGVRVALFDINFATDLVLPSGIGIGKGVSLGFGRVWRADKSDMESILTEQPDYNDAGK